MLILLIVEPNSNDGCADHFDASLDDKLHVVKPKLVSAGSHNDLTSGTGIVSPRRSSGNQQLCLHGWHAADAAWSCAGRECDGTEYGKHGNSAEVG